LLREWKMSLFFKAICYKTFLKGWSVISLLGRSEMPGTGERSPEHKERGRKRRMRD
jgi:hypothetical protein